MIDVLGRVTEYREKKGWTEYQLAEKSGLTQSTISSWYRKDMTPTIHSLEKICSALEITLSQFFASDKDNFSLTDTQKELLNEASRLTEQQQKSLITFLRTLS